MSSEGPRAIAFFSGLLALAHAAPLVAQEATAEDVLAESRRTYGPAPEVERCSAQQEAAIVSGEIIVCRRIVDQSEHRLNSDKETERAYAEATMNKGNPKTPDFIRDCHDQGWPPGCFKLGKVPPPAYFIDFDQLPEAPPGSDADRIARGLPPLGRDNAPTPPAATQERAEDNAASPPE